MQVFSCEFDEIFKNIFLTKHFLMAATVVHLFLIFISFWQTDEKPKSWQTNELMGNPICAQLEVLRAKSL